LMTSSNFLLIIMIITVTTVSWT